MRSSETRAEDVATELLPIRGWNTSRPPRGNLLWKNEYRDYPHLQSVLAGKGKQGRGGDGYPDFLIVNPVTMAPLIVGETKAEEDHIDRAISEADLYAEAFFDQGLRVLSAGVAGDDKSNIGVRINKRGATKWKPVAYRSNPIQWIPTPDETSLLLDDDRLFELQPSIPSNEILAKRGDEINRILRECKISDPLRPAITAAFMLALWQSRGKLRTDAEHILSDVNTECRKAFIKADKRDIADSIYVPEANEKLAAQGIYICHILRLLNITTLTTEHDYLGQLYEMFFRFTGGNTIGQFFTPRHITKFVTDLCRVNKEDVIVDPTCGTGGFLIAALNRMMAGRHYTHAEVSNLVKGHLMGFESEPITAALCVANMILRGDGTTGIVKGDCFTNEAYPEGEASVVLGNPPFPHKKTDDPPEKFVDRGLEALTSRGTLAMIVPSSLLVKKTKKKWRAKTLRRNTLKAVISLPSELFQPYAAYNTSILLLEKGVPHHARAKTFFCRIENDGYKIKKTVRVERSGEQLTLAAQAFQAGESVDGICAYTTWQGDEWAPGAYIKAAAHTASELKIEAAGLIRSLVSFHARYAPELARFDAELAEIDPPVGRYAPPSGRALALGGDNDRLGSLFNIQYGQKSLHNKSVLEPGASLVISSAGSNNGCYGFFDFPALLPAPFVTVQSTGSIGEAFVQMWPCGVTDDCLLLFPKHSEVDEEDLLIAASVLRLERWRFDYGRKMTPARIADFKMNRDPSLKEWIRQMRVPAEQLMSGALHALAEQPEPLDEIDMNLEEKFKSLARRWRQATGGQSSSSKITKHPAYLAIIELGMPVVPLILRSLEKRPELWFSALKTITNESPVSPADVGNVARMAQAWLQWGRDQHLIN